MWASIVQQAVRPRKEQASNGEGGGGGGEGAVCVVASNERRLGFRQSRGRAGVENAAQPQRSIMGSVEHAIAIETVVLNITSQVNIVEELVGSAEGQEAAFERIGAINGGLLRGAGTRSEVVFERGYEAGSQRMCLCIKKRERATGGARERISGQYGSEGGGF
ncbi:hypothetical protein C8J57DRAFT_1222504 [Mycena rebaudengoi]|nr:hypothetical protein C8J57DRAFT_1222504 [Mycena rebaudengoi]